MKCCIRIKKGGKVSDINKEGELENSLLKQFPVLKFFEYAHLPERLKERSKPFEQLAWEVAMDKTNHPAETATCLRKLLEAKDCAVRAILP